MEFLKKLKKSVDIFNKFGYYIDYTADSVG